jgi:ABC-2 type transport system permease protein
VTQALLLSRQALAAQRRGLLAWCAAVVGLTALYSSLWPGIRDQPGYASVVRALPQVLRSLLATTDLTSPVGYVQAELFGLTAPLLVVVQAVAGASGLAVDEERGRLDLLLAQPVTRAGVLLGRAAASAGGTLLLAAATGAALLAAGALGGPAVPAGHVAAAALHLALLGWVFGALALGVAAATGRAVLARAVPGLLAVLAYVLNGVAPLAGWSAAVRDLSPFAQYSAGPPLAAGVSPSGVVIAVATCAVLLALAVAAFRRRDVGT